MIRDLRVTRWHICHRRAICTALHSYSDFRANVRHHRNDGTSHVHPLA
jgi:hypothetical protein